jgi:uncharacterized protein involved in exopolysaccharide biosynthesis
MTPVNDDGGSGHRPHDGDGTSGRVRRRARRRAVFAVAGVVVAVLIAFLVVLLFDLR